MDIKEYKDKIYELFKEEIIKISDESEKEVNGKMWKADIGIATDIFLAQPHSEDVQSVIDKLRTQITK